MQKSPKPNVGSQISLETNDLKDNYGGNLPSPSQVNVDLSKS